MNHEPDETRDILEELCDCGGKCSNCIEKAIDAAECEWERQRKGKK